MAKLSKHLRTIHSDDGAILLNVATGRMFKLNPVGSRVIELLKLGQTQTELSEHISLEFDVEVKIVRHDIDQFLERLLREQIVMGQGDELAEGGAK